MRADNNLQQRRDDGKPVARSCHSVGEHEVRSSDQGRDDRRWDEGSRGSSAISESVMAGSSRWGKIDDAGSAEAIDASGMIVAPASSICTRTGDAQLFLGSVLQPVRLARCHVGGHRKLRLRFRADAARERATARCCLMTRIEAIPYESMRLGLPWSWVSYPEFLDAVDATPKAINILPVRAGGSASDLGDGPEGAKSGRMPTDERACSAAPRLRRGAGCRRLRLVGPAHPPSGGAAVQRDYDGTPTGHRPHARRDRVRALRRCCASGTRASCRCCDESGDQPTNELFYERLAEISGRPVLTNVVTPLPDKPSYHRNQLRVAQALSRTCGLRVIGQGNTSDAGYTFTMEDWNLFDDLDVWAEVTTALRGTQGEDGRSRAPGMALRDIHPQRPDPAAPRRRHRTAAREEQRNGSITTSV